MEEGGGFSHGVLHKLAQNCFRKLEDLNQVRETGVHGQETKIRMPAGLNVEKSHLLSRVSNPLRFSRLSHLLSIQNVATFSGLAHLLSILPDETGDEEHTRSRLSTSQASRFSRYSRTRVPHTRRFRYFRPSECPTTSQIDTMQHSYRTKLGREFRFSPFLTRVLLQRAQKDV